MGWEDIKQSASTNTTGFDWTIKHKCSYLIYGDSKVGKTYATMEKVKRVLQDDTNNTAWIFNTDAGFAEPALQYGLAEFKARIKYFPIASLKQALDTLNKIIPQIKPTDIFVFDLLAWVWDEAQKEFVNELSGGNIIGFVKKGMMDDSKYGLFQGLQWGYIKKLDDLITNKLSKNPICNIVAITSVKDVSVDYALNKKKKDLWLEIGKPAGRRDLMHDFSEIIKIEKDDRGKRRFMVVGTRKKDTSYKWHEFTTPVDFWNKIES